MKNTQENILKSFINRVNKLIPGRSTSDKFYGKVTCIKPADMTKGWNEYLKRSGYGTRKFSVSGSKMIANGKYTLGGLRAKLETAIANY